MNYKISWTEEHSVIVSMKSVDELQMLIDQGLLDELEHVITGSEVEIEETEEEARYEF